ncbi:type II secretion system F family protein, partial [Synechococcus sp. MU1644]|nr:type II secretion system F family protein [Synechococcus sp. MU1644]
MDALLQPITDALGPLGFIVLAGVLGVMMVAIVIIMMLRQPEDPLTKLKKSSQMATASGPNKERLRQGSRNEQLERFSKFLEPEDVAELSK